MEGLLVASREIGVGVDAQETEYVKIMQGKIP